MLTPAMLLNSSPLMCGLVPGPDEAKENLPGLAFTTAMNSAMLLAGKSSRVISMFGTSHRMETPVKSLAASNGSLA